MDGQLTRSLELFCAASVSFKLYLGTCSTVQHRILTKGESFLPPGVAIGATDRAKAYAVNWTLGSRDERTDRSREEAFEIMTSTAKTKTPLLVGLQCWRRCRVFPNKSKARKELNT